MRYSATSDGEGASSFERRSALWLDQQQDDLRMDALNALFNRCNERLYVSG